MRGAPPVDSPEPARDPLEIRATPGRVRRAARAAGLSEAAMARGADLAIQSPSAEEWRRFLSRALAGFGAGLVLAGAISFVAYNWARIGRYGKFALLEVAIVAAILVAWRKLPRLPGQLATFAAAVLVGPLFAIYGQTYQTGADPYGLFLLWSLLILPWAWVARFGAIWLLAVALFDVSLVLYSAQVIVPRTPAQAMLVPLAIAAIHAVGIVAWEWQMRRTPPLMPEDWVLRVGALIGFVALFIPAAVLVFNVRSAGAPGWVGLTGLAGGVLAVMTYYRRVRRDRFMITIAALAAMAWLTALAARVVFDVLHLRQFGFILMAGFVIWQITFGVKQFRRMRAT